MQGDSDLLVSSQLNETTQGVAAMLDCVQLAKQLIMDPATQHLHNIKHSPRLELTVITRPNNLLRF